MAKDFKVYGAKDGVLLETTPSYNSVEMFQSEIDSFLDCIRTGEKLPSHIDTVILSSRIIQGIYDSSELNREIVF